MTSSSTSKAMTAPRAATGCEELGVPLHRRQVEAGRAVDVAYSGDRQVQFVSPEEASHRVHVTSMVQAHPAPNVVPRFGQTPSTWTLVGPELRRSSLAPANGGLRGGSPVVKGH
jgi:hypothetical protein